MASRLPHHRHAPNPGRAVSHGLPVMQHRVRFFAPAGHDCRAEGQIGYPSVADCHQMGSYDVWLFKGSLSEFNARFGSYV